MCPNRLSRKNRAAPQSPMATIPPELVDAIERLGHGPADAPVLDLLRSLVEGFDEREAEAAGNALMRLSTATADRLVVLGTAMGRGNFRKTE